MSLSQRGHRLFITFLLLPDIDILLLYLFCPELQVFGFAPLFAAADPWQGLDCFFVAANSLALLSYRIRLKP